MRPFIKRWKERRRYRKQMKGLGLRGSWMTAMQVPMEKIGKEQTYELIEVMKNRGFDNKVIVNFLQGCSLNEGTAGRMALLGQLGLNNDDIHAILTRDTVSEEVFNIIAWMRSQKWTNDKMFMTLQNVLQAHRAQDITEEACAYRDMEIPTFIRRQPD